MESIPSRRLRLLHPMIDESQALMGVSTGIVGPPRTQPLQDRLLPEVYTLLADVVSFPGTADNYVQALRRILVAAQTSEQLGPFFSYLPLLCCQAAGSTPKKAIPVAAAWRVLQIAAKLLDDVEDGDVAAISSCQTDPARVTNLSTGFIAASNLALTHLQPDLWYTLQSHFQGTILQMAGAQHRELSKERSLNLEGYTRIMGAKSGAFFALGALAGARCATTDQEHLSLFTQFGYNVGMLLQVYDDLMDWQRPQGSSDLAMGHRTLPVWYCFEVASQTEAARLEELLVFATSSKTSEAEAHHIMIELGVETYLQAELSRYRDRALKVLQDLDCSLSGDPLQEWLVSIYTVLR